MSYACKPLEGAAVSPSRLGLTDFVEMFDEDAEHLSLVGNALTPDHGRSGVAPTALARAIRAVVLFPEIAGEIISRAAYSWVYSEEYYDSISQRLLEPRDPTPVQEARAKILFIASCGTLTKGAGEAVLAEVRRLRGN